MRSSAHSLRRITVSRTGQGVVWGPGAARLTLREAVAPHRRIFVVTGRTSYESSGAAEVVREATSRKVVKRITTAGPNPTVAAVAEAVRACCAFRPDVVLGIGGGSVLDTAKAVAVFGHDGDGADEWMRDPTRVPRTRSAALLLAPTTAGSGSEATSFATLYRGRTKLSLDSPAARADLAIVDPTLTDSLDERQRCASGLDALAHAVESYWAPTATRSSQAFAGTALAGIGRTLTQALKGASRVARWRMSVYALLAGLAIDLTRTTAAHGFSYWLVSHRGVPHGVSVSLHLRWLLEFNEATTQADSAIDDAADVRRRVSDCAGMLGCGSAKDAARLLESWLRLGGYPPTFRGWSVSPDDVADMIGDGMASWRTLNNPRRLSHETAAAAVHALMREEEGGS